MSLLVNGLQYGALLGSFLLSSRTGLLVLISFPYLCMGMESLSLVLGGWLVVVGGEQEQKQEEGQQYHFYHYYHYNHYYHLYDIYICCL